MHLTSGRRCFHWNNTAVLEIGKRHGWIRIGTGPHEGTKRDDWSGIYDSNDGRLFYARDAARLADALEVFLATGTGEASNTAWHPAMAPDGERHEGAEVIRPVLPQKKFSDLLTH